RRTGPGRACTGRRHRLQDRVDDQELYRVGGPRAARRRRAGAGRPGRRVRAGAAWLAAGEPGRRPDLDQAPADHDRRVPDRRPVGGPAAGPAAGGFRGLPGPRRPLGMPRTGYQAEEFDQEQTPGGLARGYRRGPGGWSEVPFEPCGAFAPMGGIFSCVRDLSRWVAGFAAAFPPVGPQAGGPHPVRRATRREMQLPQVVTGWDAAPSFPGNGAATPPGAYGFGLFVTEHPELGRIVSHSGGYPGFGSNMCWHPASRTGVIALGNSTYAAMASLAARLLETVLRRTEPPSYGVALSPEEPGPWPETLAARDAVDQLLRSWDDATAARLFSPNVAADAPFPETQRRIALVRERIGDFRTAGRPPEFDTPAHCRWWLEGERGVVQVQIQLTPERPPRVQSLGLAVPPAADSPLGDTLDAVVAWLNGTDRDWPASIPVVAAVDTGPLARRLRMAAVWAGE